MNERGEDINFMEVAKACIKLIDCRETMPAELPSKDVKSMLSGKEGNTKENMQTDGKVYEVNFNPSSLQFHSGTTEVKEKISKAKKEDGTVDKCSTTNQYQPLSLSVKLIFDGTIEKESQVQTEVEGFLAIVKNPYIRQASFHWGKQYYYGKITDVQAEYNMFSSEGIPLRAFVDIKMELFEKNQRKN